MNGEQMKTIGLIGGMSWESSIEYYRIINETVKRRLGGLHSAKLVMVSVDFGEIEPLQHQGRWGDAGQILIDAAQSLERGGSGCVVICTNTMHKLADSIQTAIHIPLLHIADATAEKIQSQGLHKIGLLGTRFTMEEGFYKGRLATRYGMEIVIPEDADREMIHQVIYNELCLGKILPESKARFSAMMQRLEAQGVEGIILGCTEIGLLVKPEDSKVPLFDTTLIHAEAAADWSLQN
jgi:aspartate racemase